jgi:replicative DNA helicase
MQFYYKFNNENLTVPNPELRGRLHGYQYASTEEVYEYYEALKTYVKQGGTGVAPDLKRAIDDLHFVEIILHSSGVDISKDQVESTAPNESTATSDRLEQTYYKEKTIGELEAEILVAATSKNFKLALTKVAAANNLYFDAVEAIAKSLLQSKGLDNQYDLDKTEYTKLVESVRDLELKIVDQGEKAFKLLKIAKQHKLALPQLQEIYYKSLLVQHLIDPIDEQELERLYPGGQKWVMRGWIPEESITLFHAQGGVGKTLFVQHLIKHIASGTDWAEYKVGKPGGILYLQTDTAPKQLKEWLRQSDMLGRDLPIKYHLDWRVECMAQLYQWVKEQRPALVVIDSLASVNKDNTVEENHVNFAKPLLQMRDIANELGTAFFLIHHSNAGNQARGTKALRNAADAVWRLEPSDPKHPENPKRILTMEKFRARMPLTYELELNDDDFSWELLEKEPQEGHEAQNTGARWLIVDYLNKNPGVRYCNQDLAHVLGLKEATIRKELPGLYREGLIDREINPKFTNTRSVDGQPRHHYLIHL